MNCHRFSRTRLAAALSAAALGLGAGQAWGAAFALQEQNASGLGHAYAGGAAAAEDVSTIFYNPAGLVRLQSTQAVLAANVICLSAKFNNSASQPAALQPLGGNGGDAGDCNVVPNFYLGVPFTDKWSFGIGVNVPFGLKTNYDSGWIGRFQALESKVETINVNPVLSWEPTKNLTVGAGFSWQRLKATLTSQFNYAGLFAQGVGQAVAAGLVPAAAAPTLTASGAGLETNVNVNGDDSSWGWNAGVLWQFSDQTRVGAAYRSTVKYTVGGTANFSNPTAASLGPLPPPLQPAGATIVQGTSSAICGGLAAPKPPNADGSCSDNVSLAIKLPDTANVSIFHQFNNKWDLMADLQWTGWHSIQSLTVVRSTGEVLTSYPENFRNTWRVSAGANYRYSDQWMFRGGVAYDQSPVNDTDRTPRLPDNDRTWLAMGVQYKFNPQWSMDLAYAYIWVKSPSINQNAGSTPSFGLINGSYSSNVNIVGLQITYTAK